MISIMVTILTVTMVFAIFSTSVVIPMFSLITVSSIPTFVTTMVAIWIYIAAAQGNCDQD